MAKSNASRSSSASRSKKTTSSKRSRVPSLFGRQFSKPALFVAAFAIVGLVTLLASFAAVPTGAIKNTGNGKCLENFFNIQKDGNFVSTYTCNSSNQAQKWSFYSADKSIRTAQNFCLDVRKGGKVPMTKVHLWRCTGGVPQKWDKLSSGQLRNPNSMLCLEVGSTNNFLDAPNLYVNTCNTGNKRQLWATPTTVIPVPSPSPTNPTPEPPQPSTPSTGRPSAASTGPRTAVARRGSMTISQPGYVLRDFHIVGGTYGIKVTNPDPSRPVIIEYGIIEGMDSAAIYGSNFIVRYVEMREGQRDGVKPLKNVTAEHNYIHHIGKAVGSHADAFQLQAATNIRARGNYCDIGFPAPAGYNANACFMIQDGSNNVVIENNWLNGGNYTINCAKGFSNITIRNNWWGTHNFGRVAGCSSSGDKAM